MRYTDTHEWIRMEGTRATVGISRHAQEELGEIVYIELPKVGDIIEEKQEVCVLESTKAAVDIYSPVGGRVTRVNEALRDQVDLINQDPEGRGWIFEVECG